MKKTSSSKHQIQKIPVTAHKLARPPSIAWCSDLHLDHVDGSCFLDDFCQALKQCPADILLITGDVANARTLDDALEQIAVHFHGSVYFILGNHDYYHSSFAQVHDRLRNRPPSNPVTWMDGENVASFRLSDHLRGGQNRIALDLLSKQAWTDRVWVCGIAGWACGRAGSGVNSPVQLNDFRFIAELASCGRDKVAAFALIDTLASESAALLEHNLRAIAPGAAHVIVPTHVPPYPEAVWHMGARSKPDFLPYFCNLRLGEMLDRVVSDFPTTSFTVLCGHTHGEGFYRRNNVQVVTAAATYGRPQIYRMFPGNFWTWSPARRETWHRSKLPATHQAHIGKIT